MDIETYGFVNEYDYGFRIYNPRLGKFLSIDPLTKSYPMLTPYQFASNTPIQAIDLGGLEAVKVTNISVTNIQGTLKVEGAIEVKVKVINLSSQSIDFSQLKKDVIGFVSGSLNTVAVAYGENFYEWNFKSNNFDYKKSVKLDIMYSMQAKVNVEIITDLSQLKSNDLIIGIVNEIGYEWKDKSGKIHYGAGGLVEYAGARWGVVKASNININKNHTFIHELFHTIGLSYLEGEGNKLMYHLGDQEGWDLNNSELYSIYRYLIPLKSFNSTLKSKSKTYENSGTLPAAKNFIRFLNIEKYKIKQTKLNFE